MKLCPTCGAKEFHADHRGQCVKENCAKCGSAPKMQSAKRPVASVKPTKNPFYGE